MKIIKIFVGLFIAIVIIQSAGFFNHKTATLVGAGTLLSPYRIENCMDLQSIRLDPDSHYIITRNIDCDETKQWNISSCSENESQAQCSLEADKCFWNKSIKCKDEIYEGCAFDKYDCIEWCGGKYLEEKESCESEYGFVPIGTFTKPFTGVLDGSGHTISNINIYWPNMNGVGLIGVSNGGIIKNIKFVRSKVTGGTYVGGIVGKQNDGFLKDIKSEFAVVKGDTRVGGIAGKIEGKNKKEVISKTMIYNCNIEGLSFVGGLVGENIKSSIIKSVSEDCNIVGKYDAGGLAGVNVGGKLTNSLSNVTVGTGTRVGGVVGVNEEKGVIENSLSLGSVFCSNCAVDKIGGLVAYNETGSSIKTSYYNGDKISKEFEGKRNGIAKSFDELSKLEIYKEWNFNNTNKLNNTNAYSDKRIETKTEKDIETGSTITGTVYKVDNGKLEIAEGLNVAISVNGDLVKTRGVTDNEGKYKLNNVRTLSGDLLTIFIEGMETKAITILKKTKQELTDINLYENQLRISGRNKSLLTTDDIGKAIFAGDYTHPDIGSMLIKNKKNIVILEGKTLFVETGSILRLNNDLVTDNLILEGVIVQKQYDVTVNKTYTQKGGIYDAGIGTTLFNGDVIIKSGKFNGNKGLVEMSDDFVGVFKLEGGVFVSPTRLIIKSDWIQGGGDFVSNNATVVFAGTTHIFDIKNEETLYNVVISKKNNTGLRIANGDILKISNDLTLVDGMLEGGEIQLEGALVHKSNFDGGDALLRIVGNNKRNAIISVGGKLPSMDIDAKDLILTVVQYNKKVADRSEGNAVIIDEPFTINSGKFIINDNVWFSSNIEINGGSIESNNGIIVINEPLIIKNGSLISKNGTITLNSPLTLSGGNVMVNDSLFIVNGNTLIKEGTFNGGNSNIVLNGNLTLTGGKLIAPSKIMTIKGDMIRSNKEARFVHNGGAVVFAGLTKTIDMNRANFANLIINKNPDSYLIIASGSTITTSGNVYIKRGAMREETVKVYGNLLMEKGAGTGTTSFEFRGIKDQVINFEHPKRFRGNITVRKTGTRALRLESDIFLSRPQQKINILSGKMDMNKHNIEYLPKSELNVSKGATLIFRGREKHPIPNLKRGSIVHYIIDRGPEILDNTEYYDLILDSTRGLKFKPSSKGLNVKNNLILKGGVLEANINTPITIGGSWINKNGRFVSGNGDVIFKGESNLISGDNIFFNLEKKQKNSVLVLESNTTQKINGNLTLNGSECDLLLVRSKDRGESSKLEILGNAYLSSLDIRGIEYIGQKPLTCKNECIDNGNNDNIDFAYQKCKSSKSYCGNNLVSKREECDDGNNLSKDGCSALCKIEVGFKCNGNPSTCTPICGDKLIRGDENCDDGNEKSNDGCSKSCRVEKGYLCAGERSRCMSICGDGLKIGSEECDDKNLNKGDGCNEFCQEEIGYECAEKKGLSICKEK